MRNVFMFMVLLMACGSAFAKTEIRNGWFVNETPANMSLIDRHGEWVIGTQGGDQAEWETMTDFTANEDQFVQTNPPHGYSCVSMKVEVNKVTKQVTKVLGGKQLRLKDCLEDSDITHSPVRYR